MTCREFTEFLDRYLADEVSEEERAQFERHLAVCRDCTNYLANYRDTLQLTDSALSADNAVPDSVPESMVQAVMAALGDD